MESIVAINHLSFAYGDRVALDDLSLSIGAGDMFGFLGPNGSGKTTLFRVLSTLSPVRPGHVRMFGLDIAEQRELIRRRIGVVFQSPSIDQQLSADENLMHQGHLYGLRGADLRQRITDALKAVGLLDRAKERTENFSGGMRRRVEVAKSLLHRPRVLLMDEPSTGLDPAARIDLWRHLRQINQTDGVTVLATTHLMEEAERCSRLAVMAHGKLLAADTPAALKERIGGDVITISTTDPARVQSRLAEHLGMTATQIPGAIRVEQARGHEWVPRIIEAAPGLIDAISVGKPTLEDVFIQLTGHRLGEDDADVSSSPNQLAAHA